MHEFILVLRKGDVNSGRTQRLEMLPAKHEEWTKEIANSVWHIAPVYHQVLLNIHVHSRRNSLSTDETIFI